MDFNKLIGLTVELGELKLKIMPEKEDQHVCMGCQFYRPHDGGCNLLGLERARFQKQIFNQLQLNPGTKNIQLYDIHVCHPGFGIFVPIVIETEINF